MTKIFWAIIAVVSVVGGLWGYQYHKEQTYQKEIKVLISKCAANRFAYQSDKRASLQDSITVLNDYLGELKVHFENSENPYAEEGLGFCQELFAYVLTILEASAQLQSDETKQRFNDISKTKILSELDWKKKTVSDATAMISQIENLDQHHLDTMRKALVESNLPEDVKIHTFSILKKFSENHDRSYVAKLRATKKILDSTLSLYEFLYENKDRYDVVDGKYMFKSSAVYSKFEQYREGVEEAARNYARFSR